MQIADDRFRAQDGLSVELEHQAQHAVGRRVLRPHVDDHRLVVGQFDVDVGRVHSHALGQPEDCADLAAELVRGGGVAAPELLASLGRLDEQTAWNAVGSEIVVGVTGERVGQLGVRVRGGVAHRGPGASLNWTGTRPTP